MEKTQNGKLAKAAMIVMSSIILSRITGFLRVVLIPYRMGVSKTADAYNIAFLLPDLMFNLLVGGAIASALIPVLSGYIENKKEKEGWISVSSFLNSIMLGIAVFCILGAIFTPQIIPVVAPGFKTKGIETQLLAINLTRVLFPSVSFLMLAGLCNGVLNSYRRFASAAYGPCIYNLGSAASIFIFGSKNAQDVQKVAYGVLASAFIYFVFQLVFTIKHLRFYKPSIHFKNKGFIGLVKLAVPSLLSSSVVQLNVIISASFVTLFREGSYTAFKMADTVWQLPYGIFAQGIGIAMLPTLSASLAAGRKDEFKNLLEKGLRAVLLPAIPSAIGLIVLREPILTAIFKWNANFNDSALPLTGSILMLFSTALITQSIVAVMNRGFYADNDTTTPLLVGIGTIVLNYVLGFTFVNLTGFEAAGMALSYSIISLINAILLGFILKRRMKLSFKGIYIFALKVLAAAAVMGLALYVFRFIPVHPGMKAVQLLLLGIEVFLGGLIFFAFSHVLKVDEVVRYSLSLKSKFKKKKNSY